MFNWIPQLFGYLLYWIYNLVNNYGVAILVFTLLTKLILLPFTIKQQKSLEKSKEMQPLLQDLQNRYKDDQQKLAEEYQKLMANHKFNPFGGCLLSLIQIPIIIGMLYVVGKPLSYMVKMPQEEIKAKIMEIMPEGSTEEDYETFIKQNRYVELKVIKQEELLNLDFLGINLGDVASENRTDYKLLIIPLLSTLFTGLSVFVMNKQNQPQPVKSENAEEEMPMPNMKVMNVSMVLLSGWIAYIVPQGLGLYWFFSSLLQICIQFGMKKLMKKDTKLIEEK
ncbi:MAG: YidC/Oxa1 family membrane protein insertase [Clostridia bacterium]|nr:YidC/Oxa1 family membrane protein insertase [Clostridia bacterium]